jgi:hypothetical protein
MSSDLTPAALPEGNPSYQNYIAKQMLANPRAYGLAPAVSIPIEVKNEAMADPELVAAQSKLHALLDSIDGNKRKRDDEEGGEELAEREKEQPAVDLIESPFDWSKHTDPSTGVPYYFNHRTGASQWERPSNFIEPADAIAAPDYGARATFASKNGAFSTSGDSTYFEKVNCEGSVSFCF